MDPEVLFCCCVRGMIVMCKKRLVLPVFFISVILSVCACGNEPPAAGSMSGADDQARKERYSLNTLKSISPEATGITMSVDPIGTNSKRSDAAVSTRAWMTS